MDLVEIQQKSEYFLDLYRKLLNIDPMIQVKVHIIDNLPSPSVLVKHQTNALCWTLQLEQKSHTLDTDIQYSIIEALIKTMFCDIELFFNDDKLKELSNRIITRLTISLSTILDVGELNEGTD